jgi:hypothetical protein
VRDVAVRLFSFNAATTQKQAAGNCRHGRQGVLDFGNAAVRHERPQTQGLGNT